jgi:hypothetical protein
MTMREYTSIIRLTVIASVMAENEDDANVRAWGTRYVEGYSDGELHETYCGPPELVRPQVIGLVAYQQTAAGYDLFKARSFKEAAREINPDIEQDCEPLAVVFPPRYPGLPS